MSKYNITEIDFIDSDEVIVRIEEEETGEQFRGCLTKLELERFRDEL